ncbi:MAG: nitrilase-related carbon-nitrogen hydrolase [Verrucomicrobiota bacterium]
MPIPKEDPSQTGGNHFQTSHQATHPGWLLLKICAAALAFNAANNDWGWEALILIYAWILYEIAKESSSRRAFYGGLAVGFLGYAGQLQFFWNIFGPGAMALWSILAVYIGLFTITLHRVRVRWGPVVGLIAAPVLWIGWEYFRSELNYLRFTWLTLGGTLAERECLSWTMSLGSYGVGGVIMLAGATLGELPSRYRTTAAALVLAIGMELSGVGTARKCDYTTEKAAVHPPTAITPEGANNHTRSHKASIPISATNAFKIGGIQTESAMEDENLAILRHTLKAHPELQVLVLSEYSFCGPIPPAVRAWAKASQRYVIAGGKEPVGEDFENSVYVVGPDGEVVFRQVKSVPIQFFKDGLPAREKKVWASPWGRLAFPICYDLSYTRVGDAFVAQGTQGFIVAAMDSLEWGEKAHQLNARITRLRAAEYRLPIFRLASSGISQCVRPDGSTLAQTPMGSELFILASNMHLPEAGRIPWDRHFVMACSVAAWLALGWGLCRRKVVIDPIEAT